MLISLIYRSNIEEGDFVVVYSISKAKKFQERYNKIDIWVLTKLLVPPIAISKHNTWIVTKQKNIPVHFARNYYQRKDTLKTTISTSVLDTSVEINNL